MVNLPKNYEIVKESKSAVLAINEKKMEYVAWTKDANNGVCWGRYYSFWNCNEVGKLEVLSDALLEFIDKTKNGKGLGNNMEDFGLYIVRVWVEMATYEYEYGNIKHARVHFNREIKERNSCELYKYENGKEILPIFL